MNFKDLQDLVNGEMRKKDKARTAKMFVIGLGVAAAAGVAAGALFALKSGKETREDMKKTAVDTVETIRENVKKKAETVNDLAANAVHGVNGVIEDIQIKADGVKRELKGGRHEAVQDIHKTAEDVSNELK